MLAQFHPADIADLLEALEEEQKRAVFQRLDTEVASLVGTLVPIMFKRLGFDPAVASGPFVTTANDITGILIYLSISTLLLKYIAT